MVSRWFQMLVLGLAAVLAAGCATVREVDSQVQSWSTLRALPVPPTYRLEKLPSQQSTDKAFAPIEAEEPMRQQAVRAVRAAADPQFHDRCSERGAVHLQ